MSLLREIQSTAVDSTVPLAALLRKCIVLAARLGNPAFRQWIDSELCGYSAKEDLPTYRIISVQSLGNFSGPFGSGLENAPIPLLCIPEKYRENLAHSYLMEPVAGLESLVQFGSDSNPVERWNPDLVAHVGGRIYGGMNCIQAWKVIPRSGIVSAIDNVRTRVLNFALEIESEAPDAGEAAPNSSPVPQEKVSQIFNTQIYGNVHNLATASNNVRQVVGLNEQDAAMFRDLLAAITASGVSPTVASAVEEMRAAESADSFREAYIRFMSVLSDHMQVLGTTVGPFLPRLAALLS